MTEKPPKLTDRVKTLEAKVENLPAKRGWWTVDRSITITAVVVAILAWVQPLRKQQVDQLLVEQIDRQIDKKFADRNYDKLTANVATVSNEYFTF